MRFQHAMSAALLALALCLVASPALAQAELVTSVDRQKISIDEELQLTITVRGAFDDFQQPTINGFDVVSSSMQQVVQNRARTIKRSFTLRPTQTGTLTIGVARLLLQGRVVAESKPIDVIVEAAAELPVVDAATAQDLSRLAGEEIFIRYAVPRTRFYVGEPFPLTLELWLRKGLGYPGAELQQAARLDGLLIEDLPERPTGRSTETRIGDAAFLVTPLATVLARPLKAGKILIDSATLRISVSEEGFALAARKLTRMTQPFELEVREVPSEGRPAGFRAGNIGSFQLEARLTDDQSREPTRARTGQRLVLRAVVQGRGNLASLGEPKIDAPGFEVSVLPSTGEDEIVKNTSGMSGRRVFQWLVTPQRPGNTKSPTVTLAWWDPETERFETAVGGGKPLEVTGTAVDASAASSAGEDVGPIVESAALAGQRAIPPAESPIYWVALALPLVGFVFVEARFRRRRSDTKNPGHRLSRGAGANAKKRLRAAEQALKDGLVKDFYGQLARTLTSYLEERANIPATGMTHDQIRAAALTVGYPADLVDQIVVWMENCDFARFAPSGSAAAGMREAHARVAAIIDSLDGIQPERRP